MTEPKKKIIFFIDDEPQVRKAVSKTLSQLDNCRVICLVDAESCLTELRRIKCDIVIADVNMPDMDGIELLKRIKELRPQMPVLIITGYGDVPMAAKAFKAGALDFVEKPLNEETLLPAVKNALSKLPPDNTPDINLLTKTEVKILKQIGTGKSNKQIAADIDRSIRTVENHRHRLMQKLGVKNAVELTKIAINMGLATSK
ncbi:MAG: response regulator transcription factor [Sedimentisphaerales bacterium]|nr:response regulator transcription factor [Sedimentisphaerales bacterium]